MGESCRRQTGIDTYGYIALDVNLNPMTAQEMLNLIPCRRDDLGGMHPPCLCGDSARINPRHLEKILEQSRQTSDFRKESSRSDPPRRQAKARRT